MWSNKITNSLRVRLSIPIISI